MLVEHGCTNYLEIGSRHGDALHYVGCRLPKGSHLVAIDLPAGAWGASHSEINLERAAEDLRKRRQKVSIIYGSSADKRVRKSAAALGPFDAIFIDGDHRYAAVRADWENYRHLVHSGGLIGMHDIDAWSVPKHEKVHVPKLWKEIIDTGVRRRAIVGTQRGMGIGVLWRE